MSQNYVILTDSCSDLSLTQVQQMGLDVIPLTVDFKGQSYKHYPDERALKIVDFYNEMRNKVVATTTLINAAEYLEFFEKHLEAGKDILYIAFSSGLSGSYQSSVLARTELLEKYPDRKIMIVDSKSASMGQGLLVWYAYQQKVNGLDLEALTKWVEDNKLKLCHIFTVDDLGTLRRGGRLSTAKALIGSLLKVKPILHVDDEGKLIPIAKARGRKTSLQKMVDLIHEQIVNPKEQTIFISHGDDEEDAHYIGTLIQDQVGVKEIVYGYIGPIIGAHSGPKTIAVFYMGNHR